MKTPFTSLCFILRMKIVLVWYYTCRLAVCPYFSTSKWSLKLLHLFKPGCSILMPTNSEVLRSSVVPLDKKKAAWRQRPFWMSMAFHENHITDITCEFPEDIPEQLKQSRFHFYFYFQYLWFCWFPIDSEWQRTSCTHARPPYWFCKHTVHAALWTHRQVLKA